MATGDQMLFLLREIRLQHISSSFVSISGTVERINYCISARINDDKTTAFVLS